MWRVIVLGSCLFTRVALAEDLELHLTPIDPRATPPALALGTEATCVPDHPLITTRTLAVGAATVAIGHDCGAVDEATRLWIRAPGGGWFEGRELTYQYRGAHMTDAPGYSRLLDESLTAGTLADGQPAIVHAVRLERGTRCWKDSHCPAGSETTDRVNVVEVCRLDAPACDRVDVACGAKGCGAIALRRGTLTFQASAARIHVR